MSKKKFREASAQFDFAANERKLLDWWYKSGLVKQYLEKNNKSKKRFSFLDGPITANNPMGVHHAWGRTLKDLYQRYKNMQGFAQRFQNGFDCQGLWIEVEVEKEKGFKSKKDIESYGLGKFVADCIARVEKYARAQTEQSKRLGYFMDWDNSYYTMSEGNNYTIWHFLKRCYEEGNIYKGNDSVPWCPRCGTSISQHEIATEGYKQLTHQSVYMVFPVLKKGKKTDEHLLVWTTTAWTIPADTLVAVHPEIKYALVEDKGVKYWLAQSLVKTIFGKNLKPLKTASGKELIEKEGIIHYRAPFDDLPVIKKVSQSRHFHQLVLAEDLVNEKEGTGLVHIVPGSGTEDHRLVKNDLGWQEIIFPVVDEAGFYLDGYGFLTGKNAKDHPELVIDYLKEKENGRYLLKTQSYTHSYPVCWRCGAELIWRIVDEWYIAMDNPRQKDKLALRERMKRVTKKINWYPKFGLKRELDWLKNMDDWMISKKRYWGLALPIWECSCGHFEVIGSKEELKKRAVSGWSKFEGRSPHRPQIDKVKIKCSKCGKAASRIPDVGNPWLDAGIVSFSTLVDPETKKVSYLDDKKYWRKWFPADFVTECFPGQFRNWFYSLIAMATVLEDSPPFKNLLGHASVRNEKGEEMHKSTGTAIWFDEAAEKMGVDTMRWLYARQNPEHNLNFGYKIADEVRRQRLFLYWNTFRFFVTYANLNSWSPKNYDHVGTVSKQNNPLDAWIASRLETTKKKTTAKLDKFAHHEAIDQIEKFLEDLSLWYVRRSRERLSPNNPNRADRDACLNALYHTLSQLTLMLAPFIPYLTETVWQNLKRKDKLTTTSSVHLQDWPKADKDKIDASLEEKMAYLRQLVSLAHAARKEKQLKVRQPLATLTVVNPSFKLERPLEELIKAEVNVKKIVTAKDKGGLSVKLDTKLTPKLKAEGEARELIRQIQVLRRQKSLALKDKVVISAPSWPKEWEKEILTRTGAKKIRRGERLKIIPAQD